MSSNPTGNYVEILPFIAIQIILVQKKVKQNNPYYSYSRV
jgi:hypothetical protein